MRKIFTHLPTVAVILLLNVSNINATDVLIRFSSKPASVTTSYTFSTTDVLYASDPTSFSGSNSNVVFASPNNVRIQVKEIILELKSTSASAIRVYGMSSGASSTRTIYQVSVADAKAGPYTLLDDVSSAGTKITSDIVGQDVNHCTSVVTGLNIAQGKFVKISFCTSSSSTTTQNLNVSGFDITPASSSPTITAFLAAGVSATIDQTAKTITAVLPYGTNLTSITPTVTIGGSATSYSPTGAKDFSGGAVTYTVTDGTNNVDYAVTLTASTTPSSDKDISNLKIGGYTPEFNSGTNTYSMVLPKASSLNQVVTFDIPATATSVPASGATLDLSTPQTIKVTAQDNSTQDYTVTASVGNKNIAYIINTAVSSNDTQIRPMLAANNYVENILIGGITTSTDFSLYDLVILTEAPSTGTTGMIALWGINKPLLCFKTWAIKSNTWNLGTPADVTDISSITVNEPNHPIFSGITLTGTYGNELAVLTGVGSGEKSFTECTYSGNYNIANVLGKSINIIDLPIGTTSSVLGVKSSTLQNKLLIIGIADISSNNLTADGLKMIQNACDYLMGSTTWGTNAGTQFKDTQVTGTSSANVTSNSATISWSKLPVAVSYTISSSSGSYAVKGNKVIAATTDVSVDGANTSYNLTGLTENTDYTFNIVGLNANGTSSSAGIVTFKTPAVVTSISPTLINGVTFDGKNILNSQKVNLNVFDLSGRFIINSNQDISMSNKAKGIYIIKADNGVMKIAVR